MASIRVRDPFDEERSSKLGRAFRLIGSKQFRHDDLQRRQSGEKRHFDAKQRDEIRSAQERRKRVGKDQAEANLSRFYAERKELKLKQGMDAAKLRAEWKERGKDRKVAWKQFRLGQFLKKHSVGINKVKNVDRSRSR